MLIFRALYGLKSSGAARHKMFADGMHSIGFVQSKVDPDVWMRPAAKSNGEQYYKYLLVYADDILSISEEPEITID